MAFRKPNKEIVSPEQLAAFEASQTYRDIIAHVEALNESVVGVKLTDKCSESEVCTVAGCPSSAELMHTSHRV